jgi:hypothetical protein
MAIWANDYSDFKKYYYKHNYSDYKKACQIGKKIVYGGERDEKILSLIGVACMRADYIDMLSIIQSRLYQSEKARKNATVFSSLILQKRLIYQFLYDDVDLSTLALPISNHPLSKTFVAIRDKEYTTLHVKPKMIEFKDADNLYRVYIDYTKSGKVAIDITLSDGTIQQHRYR